MITRDIAIIVRANSIDAAFNETFYDEPDEL